MVEHPEVPSDAVQHRKLLGGVTGHDVGVLVVGGLAADLTGEGTDVVGHEPVHRGADPGGGTFHGAVAASPILPRLSIVEGVVELGVGVEVLLARIRVGRVHVGGDGVRHHLLVGTVFGPVREWGWSGPCR